jgi:predicted Zn-dependent peptidase
MKLINIETYDTKRYTFRNEEGLLYHVIRHDDYLNNSYPEYHIIGPNQKEVVEDEMINEIKKLIENWEK